MKKFQELIKPRFCSDKQEMEQFRFSNGLGFPKSYIDFATTCGYGRLLDFFITYIPMGNHPDSWYVQTKYIKMTILEAIRLNQAEYEPDGNKELLERAIPFAMSENGDYLFWDIIEMKDNEYPIYVLGQPVDAIWFGANNLYEFVEKCNDRNAVKKILGTGAYRLSPTFQPLTPYHMQ